MLDIILFFLGASILLYIILGGADFGAGIVELLSPKKLEAEIEDAVYKAIGPVWEANHMWVILAVVILFNGFPKAYAELSILLHIPLTLMLMGIIVRGCAFTFRHYDAKQSRSTRLYSISFKYSSLFTSIIIGILAASLMTGKFVQDVTSKSYLDVYWFPWANPFCLLVGVFVALLFAYQAAVFLVGEEISDELRTHLIKLIKKLNLASIVVGAVVLGTSYAMELGLLRMFFESSISLLSLMFATLLVLPIWQRLRHPNQWPSRALLGIQMSCVLLGWVNLQFPNLFFYEGHIGFSLVAAAAPHATLKYLTYALVGGSILIFPALGYLFVIFKKQWN